MLPTALHLRGTPKRPLSGRPRYGHVPLPGGLNSSYYDNKMAILQSQLLYYGTQSITLQRRIVNALEHGIVNALILSLCVRCASYVHVVCVYNYNYSHVVCYRMSV